MVVVPLTSNLKRADYDMVITNTNLEKGSLVVDSRAKINRIFSVEQALIRACIGRINEKTFSEIRTVLSRLVE